MSPNKPSVLAMLLIAAAAATMRIVESASSIQPPCNVSNMPAQGGPQPCGQQQEEEEEAEEFDEELLEGQWYLSRATSLPSFLANITGFAMNLTADEDELDRPVLMLNGMIEDSVSGCLTRVQQCQIAGSTCAVIGQSRNYTFLAVTPTLMALWSENTFTSLPHPALTIYTRNRLAPLNLTSISAQLTQFCGANATDPASSFYGVQLNYSNFTC
ncbi:uncharacterized protein LOC143287394 [Babylonia areolata]|uniref:uncharacterized protein LOC143287394 n=1 Tax=Babylonia areolata TaxID=304850 RepID=UPI003FD2A368